MRGPIQDASTGTIREAQAFFGPNKTRVGLCFILRRLLSPFSERGMGSVDRRRRDGSGVVGLVRGDSQAAKSFSPRGQIQDLAPRCWEDWSPTAFLPRMLE